MGEESHFQNFFEEEEQEERQQDEEEQEVNGLSASIGWPAITNHTTSSNPSTPWHTFALDGTVLESDSVSDMDMGFESASEGPAVSHPHFSQSHYGRESADLSEDDVVVVAVSGSHITTTDANSKDDDDDDDTGGK